jgi:integrase
MTLRNELDRYLTVRRSLGYKLGSTERVLRRFVDFAEAEQAQCITIGLVLRWQNTFGQAGRQTRAGCFGMVRLFAQWLHGLDPTHEMLPRGLVPSVIRRPRPHIYSAAEIAAIVDTAAELPSVYGMRGLTCSTLFGLIAVTGLRISEALGLDAVDVDLNKGVLYIRLVCQRIGMRSPQQYYRHGRGPRIHDLRHSFAVGTIIDWYRTGKDPSREMIKLTTYLGHTSPHNTYWYIEAVPELLELASHRVVGSADEEMCQ